MAPCCRSITATAAAGLLLLFSNGSPMAEAMVKGVPPEAQEKYKQAATFRCLDGKNEVPFASVNDDYCDCVDGSDEPGTGACSGQEATLFHCPNAGGVPQMVYASRVGDGICDCCDGSDEAELIARRPNGAKACRNTCVQEGAKQAGERAFRLESLRKGLEKKTAMIEKVTQERKSHQSALTRLSAELPGLEVQVKSAKEKKEANDLVVMQSDCQNELPKLREQVKSLEATVEELRKEITELKGSAAAAAAGEEKPVVSEYAKWMDGASEAIDGEDSEDDAAAEASTLAASLAKPSPEVTPVETEGAAEDPLAKELSELEGKVRKNQDESGRLQKLLTSLPEDRLGFASLMGRCLEHRVAEYNYKFCFFEDAKQDHTKLGGWDGFKGPKQALFNNGQMCYGGPARSLSVIFECSDEEAIVDVGEPSRCAYQAVVKHPGACDAADAAALEKPPTRHPKDEL